jgi:uncharacterized repeat protein (TIGR01451 family)
MQPTHLLKTCLPYKQAFTVFFLAMLLGFSAGSQAQSTTESVAGKIASVKSEQEKSAAAVQADVAQGPFALTAFLVKTDAQGKEVLEPAQAAQPGDTIEYRLSYRNATEEAVTGLNLDLPIPEGTTWVQGSAEPNQPQARTAAGDGYAPIPLMRVVKDSNGQEKSVPVPIQEYRSLRWGVEQLGAGQSFDIKARVRVLDSTAVEPDVQPESASSVVGQ